MNYPRVLCPRCGGLLEATIVGADKACGSAPNVGEGIPRTECLGMTDFKARVAKLLTEVAFVYGWEDEAKCPSCRAGMYDGHRANCELAALLRESEEAK